MKQRTATLLGKGTADRIIFFGLLVLLFWLPLPWGSNRPWAEALIGILAGTLCTIYLLCQLPGALDRANSTFPVLSYTLPILLWLVWLAWGIVQMVPLDFASLQSVSPAAARLYTTLFPDMASEHAWPISIQPGLTFQRWTLALGYFSLYLLVLGLARDRSRLNTLANVLVFSALLQAIYGGVMVLSRVEYGFFEHKTAYLGVATGTFVNRNHLAGYLELGAAVGIGLILADLRSVDLGNWRKRVKHFLNFLFSTRLRTRVFLAVIVVGLVLTRSRGGNSAFFGALVVCAPAYMLLKERRLFLKSMVLFVSLLAVDVWIVSGWYGLGKLATRVEQTHEATEDRTYAFAAYPGIIEQYWRTGSGEGTFATVFAANQPAKVVGYYDHAHNDYAEFLIEAGAPGFLVLLLLVGITGLHALRVILRRNDRLRVGMCFAFLMATAELAIHSFTDFNLQIPANAATYVTLMAMAGACAQDGRRRRKVQAVVHERDEVLSMDGSESTDAT
ncbi:MAG: O-antigen ligase family protein [Stenotrophobium sp.]